MMLTDKKAISVEEEDKKRLEEEKIRNIEMETTCECVDRENDQSLREKEASSSIAFEDALHNQVYVKRKSRRKRDVGDTPYSGQESEQVSGTVELQRFVCKLRDSDLSEVRGSCKSVIPSNEVERD